MKTGTLVLIVDDDSSVLRSLKRLLEFAGHQVRTFHSTAELRGLAIDPGLARCAMIDLFLDGGNGLEVQSLLDRICPGIPVIFMSGQHDVPATVQAIKAGALDFLIKPLDEDVLLAAVDRALKLDIRSQQERRELAEIRRRFDSLTPREHDVFELIVNGMLNKQAAASLGVVEKTIKVHRGRIMKKMRVASLAELVQLAMRIRDASPTAERTSAAADSRPDVSFYHSPVRIEKRP